MEKLAFKREGLRFQGEGLTSQGEGFFQSTASTATPYSVRTSIDRVLNRYKPLPSLGSQAFLTRTQPQPSRDSQPEGESAELMIPQEDIYLPGRREEVTLLVTTSVSLSDERGEAEPQSGRV